MQKSSRRKFSVNAVPLSLCTFFFEKKVRKKAIQEAHPPERPPAKVQGGAYLPRRLYQSKGGSIGSNLKRLFYCAELLCLRGREKVWDFFLAEQEIKALPLGETKKERTKQLPKFLLPTFLFKEKYGFFSKKSRAAYYVVSGEVRNI